MNPMMQIAQGMMMAVQCLIKECETIQGKRIDEQIAALNKVVTQQLPLRGQILNNFYFALVHTLQTCKRRKHLDEHQIEAILDILMHLFSKQALYDMKFINSSTEMQNISALLIQACLDNAKTSENKAIIKKSLVLLSEIWQTFNSKMQAYPQICSTLFKILNNEFANQTKTSKGKQIALSLLLISFNDLFKDHRSKEQVSSAGIKDFVNKLFKKNEAEKPNPKGIKQEEKDIETITLSKVAEFFAILRSNVEKSFKSASLKFAQDIGRFCVKCIELNGFNVDTLANILGIFFFVDEQKASKEETTTTSKTSETVSPAPKESKVASLEELVSAIKNKYTEREISQLMEGMKGKMLNEARRLPRLMNEIVEEKYISSLRSLTRVFQIQRMTGNDCLLPDEKACICDSISKSYVFRFNLKISLMDNNSQSVIPLGNLSVEKPINYEALVNSCGIYSNIKTRMILQCLPLANYKQEVLFEANNLLYQLNQELDLYLFDQQYSQLLAVNYETHLVQGAVSSIVLQNLCSSHYIIQQLLLKHFTFKNAQNTQTFRGGMHFCSARREDNYQSQILNEASINQYFEHLMLLDFYENFEIKSEDVETLQLLVIENAFFCFQLLNAKPSSLSDSNNSSFLGQSYQNELRLLAFLMKKHAIENYSIRLLTEILIETLAQQSQQKIKDSSINNVQQYVQGFASSLVQRCLVQIRQIDMLQDKEGPFKLMDELFVKFKGFHFLSNEVENVITTLNLCYDRFYLRAHSSFLRLYLDFFASFINFWNEHTQIKQLTLEQIRLQKEEYKKYSDDSNPNSYPNNEDQANAEKDQINQAEQQNSGEKPFFQENETEGKKIKMGNVMRYMLLRVKTLAVSRTKIVSVLTLKILFSSLRILYKLKQAREESGINFSTNDPENVSIPDSLGPLLHEYEPSFFFILKDCASSESTYLASGLQVLNIYNKILDFTEAQYAFLMVKNIRKQLVPLFLEILKTHTSDLKNSLRGKVAQKIVNFMVDYMAKRPDEKFLKSENNEDDDKIIDALKDYKQCLIKFLKDNKQGESTSSIYIDMINQMFFALDEFI